MSEMSVEEFIVCMDDLNERGSDKRHTYGGSNDRVEWASLIGCSSTQVWRYLNKRAPIPLPVAKLVRLMVRLKSNNLPWQN